MKTLKALICLLPFLVVQLQAQIVADFSVDKQSGCNPISINFTDKSTDAVSWYWQFGNGNVSAKQNPQAVYNVPGKYTVTLIVKDKSGASDTIVKTDFIVSFKFPIPKLSGDKTEICANQAVGFLDNTILGDAPITKWVWDFGDGSSSNTQNPNYSYKTDGIYDVTLFVKDANGCSGEAKNQNYITVNKLPEISITADKRNDCKFPLPVNFKLTSIVNNLKTIKWNFGDNTNSNDQNPKHNFTRNGDFDVSVEVENVFGCTASVSRAKFIHIGEPKPDFASNKDSFCEKSIVEFKNRSNPNNDSIAWFWDFGDGATSIEANPKHQYSTEGYYTVSLTMTYGKGCEKKIEKPQFVRIVPPSTGKLPNDTVICYSKNQRFQGKFNLLERCSKLDWYVNGTLYYQNYDTKTNVVFPGDPNVKFKIKLIGINSLGCKYALDSMIYYYDYPKPKILLKDPTGCRPRKVEAKDINSHTYPIVNYHWSGPGFSETAGNPYSFTMDSIGWHKVYLKVKDSKGCSALDTANVAAGRKIEPIFTTKDSVICGGDIVTLTNQTKSKVEDSVGFKVEWKCKSEFMGQNGNDFKYQLHGYGGQVVWPTIIASSFGCPFTKAFPELKIKIKGPLAFGKMDVNCEKDELIAESLCQNYTSFYWQYINSKGALIKLFDLNIKLKLSDVKSLNIFAENSTDKCSSSYSFDIKFDPNDADFVINKSCANESFTIKSNYSATIDDAQVLWELKNIETGKISKFTGIFIKLGNIEDGNYELNCVISNPKYICPLKWKKNFTHNNWKAQKPEIKLSNTKCYPVDIEISDNSVGLGLKEHYWNINNGEKILPATSKNYKFSFVGQSDVLKLLLIRKDSFGCSRTDTFQQQFKKKTLSIARVQDNLSCDKSIVRFFPSDLTMGNIEKSYKFEWDFGYRKSTGVQDTVQIDYQRKVNIKLKVTDADGCEFSDNLNVDLGNTKPIAKFKNSETKANCPPLNVTFTDISYAGGNSVIKKWEWDFGDGTTSAKQHPFKMYIYPGTYTVSLKITNNYGCESQFTIPELVVLKGPSGTYIFDKKTSCAPLQVNFRTLKSANVKLLEFDLADGEIVDENARKHTFDLPGRYVPRLILTDTAGCKFTLPPKDTLWVYPNPVASFEPFRICTNKNYTVFHKSNFFGDSLRKIQWWTDDKLMSETDSVNLRTNSKTYTKVLLKVESNHGCVDDFSDVFSSYGMKLSLVTDKPKYCIGQEIILKDQSIKDTVIVESNLWLDGNKIPYAPEIKLNDLTKGKHHVSLSYRDIIGCSDTAHFIGLLKIGDTLPPPILTMYRATVLNDFTTQMRFAKSVEPDFDHYESQVFQFGKWNKLNSFVQEDTNLNLYNLNTLANSYCHRIVQGNFCDKFSDELGVINQCTIETKAQGDTNKSIVTWSPYLGWKQIEKYKIWRKTSTELDFKLIDSVLGNQTSYTDTSVYCNVIYDYKIEGIELNGHFQNSFSDTARAIPLHFVPVPSPEIWRATVENNQYARTEWLMTKTVKYPIDYYSIWREENKDWKLYKSQINQTEFNDFKTDVHSSNYTYKVTATDVCKTTSLPSNVGRTILLKVKETKANGIPELNWSDYIYWKEGVENYIVERSIMGSNFIEIGKVSGNITTYFDNTIPTSCVKNIVYRIVAVRNQPSNFPDSTYNCISMSNYEEYKPEIRFFIPNAFTPDNNNLNERFAPKGMFYFSYNMKIYNRWGEKVFEGSECNNSWNGMFKGQNAMAGVYAYAIDVVDVKGKSYQFNGTVQVLK